MSWLGFNELRALGADHRLPTEGELKDLLARAGEEPLPEAGVNLLVNAVREPSAEPLRGAILARSAELRRRFFGDEVVAMAPVEVSNRCASDCLFCGWRSSNPAMPRTRLSPELVLAQCRWLAGKGIRHLELVGGDDIAFVRDELPALVRALKEWAAGAGIPLEVSCCTLALTEAHYRMLGEAGADSVIIWQETYDPDLYRRMIRGGPKARGIDDHWAVPSGGDGYLFRLGSQERALAAGLSASVGAILGLGEDLNAEVLATVRHARRLLERFPDRPVIVGMPLWNPIVTPETDLLPIGRPRLDDRFAALAAVYLLALAGPGTWVFPNCRVGIDEQVAAVRAAGVFTSTEVRLGPGGYLPAMLAEAREGSLDAAKLEGMLAADLGRELPHDQQGLDSVLGRLEQFVHHHHPHEEYVARFRQEGLRLSPGPRPGWGR